MTNVVARKVQSWFTSTMPTTTKTRETIYQKAERIMADPGRVVAVLDNAPHAWVGTVQGDTGRYAVASLSAAYMAMIGKAYQRKVSCTCPRGRTGGLCSHEIVAEKMRERGES